MLLNPHETVFLDSSSTAYFVARRIVELGIGVTVITNSLPMMEAIAARSRRTCSLIGDRRHAAAADPLVRRPVRGAHGARPLRRPDVPVGQGRHARRRADRRRRARGRGQALDDRSVRGGRPARSTSPSSAPAGRTRSPASPRSRPCWPPAPCARRSSRCAPPASRYGLSRASGSDRFSYRKR